MSIYSFDSRTAPVEASQQPPAPDPTEEEELPAYEARDFYPVKLGEVFQDKYQVVAKLGLGTGSTVWLCRDLQSKNYFTLKVCINKPLSYPSSQADTEAAVSEILSQVNEADHPGKHFLRLIVDDFTVNGPHGPHRCFIYKPLGMNMTDFRNKFPEKTINKDVLVKTYQILLIGLDLLHQAGVVHKDISPNNIILGIHDEKILSQIEAAERDRSFPHKIRADRTIYQSRPLPITHVGDKHNGDVMADFYRAPEIDIWSMGVMIWDLFEGGRLFYAVKDRVLNDEQHLAEMVSLMGPRPPSFIQRSKECQKYWGDEGHWIASTPIPDQSLSMREVQLEGPEHEKLVAFARRILCWLPEERPTTEELLQNDLFKP
ncbi:kinase-like domain-containing protein [Dactylonectria macrodidyma]|uniref:EKC/KEOPS complex subunit BUD32 n=1 Tax=Dactylonectria macrodidyma TaxID=307937 RepID=A0A9P9FUK7_9HYPO|nr:kinase-like domain-containing protein [Dactylonectria macrodidyma]